MSLTRTIILLFPWNKNSLPSLWSRIKSGLTLILLTLTIVQSLRRLVDNVIHFFVRRKNNRADNVSREAAHIIPKLKNSVTSNALLTECARGKFDRIELLLKEGADVNAETSGDETPLALVLKNQTLENQDPVKTVELLLRYGAKNTKDQWGRTALGLAKNQKWSLDAILKHEFFYKNPRYFIGQLGFTLRNLFLDVKNVCGGKHGKELQNAAKKMECLFRCFIPMKHVPTAVAEAGCLIESLIGEERQEILSLKKQQLKEQPQGLEFAKSASLSLDDEDEDEDEDEEIELKNVGEVEQLQLMPVNKELVMPVNKELAKSIGDLSLEAYQLLMQADVNIPIFIKGHPDVPELNETEKQALDEAKLALRDLSDMFGEHLRNWNRPC